jgi:hypothetical protein
MSTLFEQERERMMRTSPKYREAAITEAARIARECLDPIGADDEVSSHCRPLGAHTSPRSSGCPFDWHGALSEPNYT